MVPKLSVEELVLLDLALLADLALIIIGVVGEEVVEGASPAAVDTSPDFAIISTSTPLSVWFSTTTILSIFSSSSMMMKSSIFSSPPSVSSSSSCTPLISAWFSTTILSIFSSFFSMMIASIFSSPPVSSFSSSSSSVSSSSILSDVPSDKPLISSNTLTSLTSSCHSNPCPFHIYSD